MTQLSNMKIIVKPLDWEPSNRLDGTNIYRSKRLGIEIWEKNDQFRIKFSIGFGPFVYNTLKEAQDVVFNTHSNETLYNLNRIVSHVELDVEGNKSKDFWKSIEQCPKNGAQYLFKLKAGDYMVLGWSYRGYWLSPIKERSYEDSELLAFAEIPACEVQS